MPGDREPSQPPLSIATSSLNPFPATVKAPHDLSSKLQAISRAGFRAIELAFPDFLSYAEQHLSRKIGPQDWDELATAAKELKAECKRLQLEIMMLQPFSNFEGWDPDSEEGKRKRDNAFVKAQGWIGIMRELGTHMLQVRMSLLFGFIYYQRRNLQYFCLVTFDDLYSSGRNLTISDNIGRLHRCARY